MCCNLQQLKCWRNRCFYLTAELHAVLIYNLFYCFNKSSKFTLLFWCVILFSLSVILQFNNSELRDLYVHGTVVSQILGCVNIHDVAVCHTYHQLSTPVTQTSQLLRLDYSKHSRTLQCRPVSFSNSIVYRYAQSRNAPPFAT